MLYGNALRATVQYDDIRRDVAQQERFGGWVSSACLITFMEGRVGCV
jgi:hypothetical protein